MINVKYEDVNRSPYLVLYGDYGEKEVSTPSEAVTSWFKYEKDYRSDVAIIAFTKDDAFKLIKWSHDNIDKIKDLHAKYDNPYKLDYLIKYINENYDKKCMYFTERDSGDQVSPFTFG